MTDNQGQNLIDNTIQHFQPFYEEKLTVETATEMVANFTGFARLLLKLEEKRQLAQKK
mgnify:FL=1